MGALERRVFYYDLEVTAQAKKAVPPSVAELGAVLSARVAAGRNLHMIAKETKCIILGEVQVDTTNEVLVCLFRYGDKGFPDAVYSSPTRGTIRRFEKADDEFGEVAAHVVISRLEERGAPGHYLMLVEHARGLTATLVQRTINRLLHDEFDENPITFTYGDLSGSTKRTPFLPRTQIYGRISDTLETDLNAGRITGVRLVHLEPKTPFGSGRYLSRKRSELLLGVDKKNILANAWSALRAEIKPHAKQFETARIAFVKADKTPGSVNINTETGDPVDERYIKSAVIRDITPALAQSSKTISPQLAQPMVSLLAESRAVDAREPGQTSQFKQPEHARI